MRYDHIRSILLSAKKPRLLVIGDVILDKFIWGNVDRISPEAPVQVVNIRRENVALGGAANVANNLTAIGCEVTMLGVVGADDNGKVLRDEFQGKRIHDEALFVDQSRPTTTKTRVIAGSQHVVRIDYENTDPISGAIQDRIIDYLGKNVSKFDAVIVSDYQKGVLTDAVLHRVLSLAKQSNVKTIVDPKRKNFAAYRQASIIKPNLREAGVAVGRDLRTTEDVLHAAKEILETTLAEAVLVTRGKDGMLLVDRNGHETISATAQEVYDVTGAGDTASAFLGFMVAAGQSALDAARIANLAAGVAVSRMGTVTVTIEDVLHQIEDSTSGSRKILTREELVAVLTSIRTNLTIVFTNGFFDILHVGHVTLLGKSKALGDKLIVGLNSDASIRRNKGEKRPFVSEQERAHILAALESVDYVVLFDEDTPLDLLRALKPDILVKGSDYALDDVVGRDVVESYGGKVALVDLVPGFSTTSIVESILRGHGRDAGENKKN
jgi:D-beta-D-heptose 7-phosphate kinase / D-beta-D-heptose 1-phosphate adenosyltransferase